MLNEGRGNCGGRNTDWGEGSAGASASLWRGARYDGGSMSEPIQSQDLPIRPRRLRRDEGLRAMLQRVQVRRSDIIVPVFVREGEGVSVEVASMPGVYQMSVDVALPWLAKRAEEGFGAYLIFGVIERGKKDASGTAALDENNVVCRLLRAVKQQGIAMHGITDLCFCEYTSHGHCGPVTEDGS